MTVIIAFLANIVVAVAKTVAAAITGSASMVAEATHSWVDAGNEIFLLIAERRSARPRDAQHPLGYGREAFVWSLFAAVGIFTAGAVVSIMHGVQELSNPEPVESPLVAYIVLGVSFVFEGASFVQGIGQARQQARQRGVRTMDVVLNGSDATLRAVVAEDFAALIGVLLAAGSIALHQITGNPVFDAIGSILIGILLGVVAVVLIDRNRRYLVGANSTAAVRTMAGRALLSQPEIARVTYLHLEYVGPKRLFVVAGVDLEGDASEHEIAERLRHIAQRIEENEFVETAVLGLSTRDEPSLRF
ncbi:cation diffusion facilitator family transporter [Salinibacterium sp. dk2585]|uniref:cation diffusion facilitator family transporter n=1 Tax=unclassified Salinibacterium TaxID=2632331 RepID=UPI0011C249FF|nr:MULTISPECIES: cation diffusion facilitator family transporter [unclassified Salinibacterium]QEE62021.1 cation diffusion facilitator family transporter [Salinibacterium sp. dk2585]TXK54424.1 cation diffusion facilitator family transporter [Salinibacterium sp. dk5596]